MFFYFSLQANTYHQAALYNLRVVRLANTILKSDVDRHKRDVVEQCARYRDLEAEFAEEKKRTLTLTAQLARSQKEIIRDYQKSQSFQDLLDAEYDANLPATFATCWERAVGMIGEKISSVTLEAFPVPICMGASNSGVSIPSDEEEDMDSAM